jgi:hypothetical protein
MSKNTLKAKVEQSLRYLYEQLDDSEHTYRQFRYSVVIRKTIEGIVITFKYANKQSENLLTARLLRDDSKTANSSHWKIELNNWIESDKNNPLILKSLSLTVADIEYANSILSSVAGIEFVVSMLSIKAMLT